MKKVIMTFDVGGTFSKGTIFTEDGKMLLDGIAVYESESQKTASEVLTNFVSMIMDLYEQIPDDNIEIIRLGMAFPGPFDYENGISKIRGLNKFDSLYNMNLRNELTNQLIKSDVLLSSDFKITFANDATCFAIGEFFSNRSVSSGGYFTLGTGFGSSFIKKGKLIKGEGLIPESGMIFNEYFESGILDDYLSARGLSMIARTIYRESIDLKDLYHAAKVFDMRAIEVFKQFGVLIGQAISPYVRSLDLDELVFGGQISKSFDFFGGEIQKVLTQEGASIQVRATKDTSRSTIKGLFYYENGGIEK